MQAEYALRLGKKALRSSPGEWFSMKGRSPAQSTPLPGQALFYPVSGQCLEKTEQIRTDAPSPAVGGHDKISGDTLNKGRYRFQACVGQRFADVRISRERQRNASDDPFRFYSDVESSSDAPQ